MTMMESQINARIENDLKTRGNRGLRRAGYTPPQAIRKLWEIAALHEDDPQFIERVLSGEPAAKHFAGELSDAQVDKLTALHQGWDLMDTQAHAYGLHASNATSKLSFDELRELAAKERLSEPTVSPAKSEACR